MGVKPRTTRMSFEFPAKYSDSTTEFISSRIREHNKREVAMESQRQSTGSRHAPMYISKFVCCASPLGEKDSTQCLLHTNGKQFEFTRWYALLKSLFEFSETMDNEAKNNQIKAYTSRMRHVDAVRSFEVPSGACKHGLEDGDDERGQPARKQLALAVLPMSSGSSSAAMQQTVLTGVPVPSSAKLSVSVGDGSALSQTKVDAGSPRLDDFFQLKGDAFVVLCEFLVGKRSAYKSVKTVLPRRDGESMEDYRKRVRKECNLIPTAMKMISQLLPPVLTSQSHSGALYSMLPAQHVDLLMALQRLLQPAKGIYIPFFLTPDSQELSYGVDGVSDEEMTRRSSFLELWRRALKLEGALAELGAFFMAIVKDVLPPKLTKVSPQTMGNLRALLLAGAGLYGGGASFWSAEDQPVSCLCKLQGVGSSEVLEAVDWLRKNRANAFKALYPCVDELGSLLPILARVFSLGGPLCSINTPSVAEDLQKTFNDERGARMKVYHACCQWMILYGGKLTR
jgi:hypothetical protein